MMKLPSAFAGGIEPSGSSFAITYPGVFGSRTGAAGRSLRGAEPCVEGRDCPEIKFAIAVKPTRSASFGERELGAIGKGFTYY